MDFYGSTNLEQRHDWSPSVVSFKISDEHPHPFVCEVSRLPPGHRADDSCS